MAFCWQGSDTAPEQALSGMDLGQSRNFIKVNQILFKLLERETEGFGC
jgi:hypothetical protein